MAHVLAEKHYKALLKGLLEHMIGPVWLLYSSGEHLCANQAARDMRSTPAVGSDNCIDLPKFTQNGKDVDLNRLIRLAVETTQPILVDGLAMAAPTPVESADLRILPITCPDHAPIILLNVLSHAHDDRIAIQVANQSHLGTLTGLAARIVHDLNNPLDGSLRYINLALRRLAGPNQPPSPQHDLADYLGSAKQALYKINDILADLSTFSKRGRSTIASVSLGDLLDQTVKTLTPRAVSGGINIVTVFSDDLPAAASPQLYQVFCNLLGNAIDAVVQRRRQDPDCPAVVTISASADGDHVRVDFEDTGVGLPDDHDTLFEPFVTTKGDHGGTGIGLSIARDVVTRHGGNIAAKARERGGTTFTVELPLCRTERSEGSSKL